MYEIFKIDNSNCTHLRNVFERLEWEDDASDRIDCQKKKKKNEENPD